MQESNQDQLELLQNDDEDDRDFSRDAFDFSALKAQLTQGKYKEYPLK